MSYTLYNGRKAPSETTAFYELYIRNCTEEGTFAAAQEHLERIKDMGFEWVYLLPVHPIGYTCCKGLNGSPYAVADYYDINPELGTIEDFHSFITYAHSLGLKIMMDMVFHHTAFDSVFAKNHPEWFLKDTSGNFTRKCKEWTDIIDLDFSYSELWTELIAVLQFWHAQGADGFRASQASLIPIEFWIEARQKIDPDRHMIWLGENIYSNIFFKMIEQGFGAWTAQELHQAFDITYNYDGWEKIEPIWQGICSLRSYIDFLQCQQASYPSYARKLRCLENHDYIRAASRFLTDGKLKNWTVFYQMMSGCTLTSMGQEYALKGKIDLCTKKMIPWQSGNIQFFEFYTKCFSIIQKIKERAPYITIRMPIEGGIVITRSEKPDFGGAIWCTFINLEQRFGNVKINKPLRGTNLLTGEIIDFYDTINLTLDPIIVEEDPCARNIRR